MTPLFLDTETFSEVDIRAAGAAAYARDPSTECLIITWAAATGPTYYWDLTAGPMPEQLAEAILNPAITKIAHNAPFDKEILQFTEGLETDWDSWMCSQALAYSLGFTGGMGAIQKNLGMGEDKAKDKAGHQLIMKFSKPQPKNHKVRRHTRHTLPDKWLQFIDYGVKDTESMRTMWNLMEPYNSMSDYEWEAWRETQCMNERGMPVDQALVRQAMAMVKKRKHEIMEHMKSITGLQNPGAVGQLTNWLLDRGVELPNMRKETVEKHIPLIPDDTAREVLELRLIHSQNAVAKWTAVDAMACDDGRVRGQFLYRGASRTGRDASRGINLQNLRRPPKGDMDNLIKYVYQGDNDLVQLLFGEPLDFLAGTVRGAITAEPGNLLVVSDLSSIESRVLGWLTSCTRMNNIFYSGLDTYKDFATELFKVPYEKVDKGQRTFSKPPVLGAGYMMGGQGLQAYAENMGVDMTYHFAKNAVDTFRSIYPEIPVFWDTINAAIKSVTLTGQAWTGYRLTICRQGDYLMIYLPSGRFMAYQHPQWKTQHEVIMPDGYKFKTDCFSYMGIYRNASSNQWQRIQVHAGGITENIIQGIARDILIEWCRRVRGLNPVGRVHDEVIIQTHETNAYRALELVNAEIAKGIDWAPGLLLAAEGMVTKHYDK